jgi:hypothetical protein
MHDRFAHPRWVDGVSLSESQITPGIDERQNVLFARRPIEDRIPADHPLRAPRKPIDPTLVELSPRFQAATRTTTRLPSR